MGSSGGDNLVLARVDLMLDSLDRLAQIETSPTRFYAELLGQLKLVLVANNCCILTRIQSNCWKSLSATNALFGEQAAKQFTSSTNLNALNLPLRWVNDGQDCRWIGFGLQGANWTAGGIVAQMPLVGPSSKAGEPHSVNVPAVHDLLEAFAEIVNRFQLKHGFTPVDPHSSEVRSVAASILACNKANEADKALVEGARCLIDADRVTLAKVGVKARDYKTLAISGHPKVDPQSNFVCSLRRHLHLTDWGIESSGQLVDWALEIESAVAIAYSIPHEIGTSVGGAKATSKEILVLEWFDHDRYVHNAPRIESVLPWLAVAWKTHSRSPSGGVWESRLLKTTVVAICLVCCAIYFGSSAELTIQSQGTLQPSVQRFVFAPAEGFVEKILVADGQLVRSGEIIATMESPQLQLQINQVAAEIGIVDQKRDGLNITLNQLKPADDQSSLAGSRLAGEVQELETRRQNLLEQKALLDREQARLQLRSPINGTVIAWEVDRHLETRPVRRGDLLFRIASLEGQWQIESTIVDWESGYVIEALEGKRSEGKPLAVEFVLASTATDRGTGKIDHFGKTMRDVNGNQQLDLVVAPDLPIEKPRLGTSATVSIPCGQFPRWFVWTRSIMDALRRRFWL